MGAMGVAEQACLSVKVLLCTLFLDVGALGFLLVQGGLFRGDAVAFGEDFRFGGSVEDLAFWTLGRILFFVLSFVFLHAYTNKRGVRVEMLFAIADIVFCLALWGYLCMKMLVRLVEDGPWQYSEYCFWGAMGAQAAFGTFEATRFLHFLRRHVVYRVHAKRHGAVAPGADGDLAQQLLSNAEAGGDPDLYGLTPRQRHRKQQQETELFGNAFDWFYGRIDGKDAEEDVGAKEVETPGEKDERERHRKNVMVEMAKITLPYWRMLIFACIALLVAAVGQALIPSLTGQIIENIGKHPDDKELLERSVGKLLIAGLVTAVFSAFRGSCFTVAKGLINKALREKLLESLLRQEVGFFDTAKSGKLNSRLNTDTTVLSDQVSLSVNVFSRSIVQAVCVLVLMFRINVELSLATFLTVPAVAVVTQLYGDLIWHLFNEAQKRLANANGISDAALTTMQNVRCFASEKAELKRYSDKMELYMVLQNRMGICYTVYAIIFTLLPCLATALVLYYGGKLASAGVLGPGQLVSFMLFQQALSQAINDIGSVFSDLAGAMGAGDKVFELINRQPRETPKGDYRPAEFQGSIEFKDVRFKYPARPDTQVLNGVNLTIRPGEVVALTGDSGGGKSSILKLIERLYDAESGQILLSGAPIDAYDHQYLHEKITIVGQEPVLYARTIAENIMYGLEGTPNEPDMPAIIKAAKDANAHDFIMAFEDGYDTMCGDRGITLSGGQKQRIAIARALVRSGNILLLDEATSALDSTSEKLVQETLDKIIADGNRTAVIVAHRLSSIQNCDRIIAMQKGQIVEEGSHETLMAKKGLYYTLVQRQMCKD